MELSNEFRVPVPVDQAWALLTDVERIAPCMPGAQLQEVEGDEYRGIVKVKVGPITAQYKGKARFQELDADGRRAVLLAEGRETRGQGNANATIAATLEPDGDGTKVVIVTDLAITGRVAQFGRGVLVDVSAKLLDQFVACLEADVLAGESGEAVPAAPAAPAPAAPAEPAQPASGNGDQDAATDKGDGNGDAPRVATTTPVPRRIEHRAAEPVDLLQTAGAPVAKRLVPLGLAALLILLFLRRRKHR
jgi:carbon monoxide dehydrogenase subunit G